MDAILKSFSAMYYVIKQKKKLERDFNYKHTIMRKTHHIPYVKRLKKKYNNNNILTRPDQLKENSQVLVVGNYLFYFFQQVIRLRCNQSNDEIVHTKLPHACLGFGYSQVYIHQTKIKVGKAQSTYNCKTSRNNGNLKKQNNYKVYKWIRHTKFHPRKHAMTGGLYASLPEGANGRKNCQT